MGSTKKLARRAFTLVELLVVVAIITLLIAVMLPSLSKAKQTASRSVCGTLLHGLGVALHSYLAEFDNVFPINGIMFPKSGMPTVHQGDPMFQRAEAPIPTAFLPAGFPDLSQDAVNGTGLWRPEFGALFHYMGGQLYDRMDIPTLQGIAGGTPLPAMPKNIAKAYLCPEDVILDRSYTAPAGGNYGVHPLVMAPTQFPLVYELDGSSPDRTVPGGPGYWSYSVNSVLNSMGRFRNYFTNPPATDSAGNPWTSPAIPIPWPDPIKMGSIKNAHMIVFIEEANGSLFND